VRLPGRHGRAGLVRAEAGSTLLGLGLELDGWGWFHACVAACWAASCASILRDLFSVPIFPKRAALAIEPGTRPSITVVVPARDEAVRIESTLCRLMAQEDVALEVIVVDDRSEDATPRIVDEIAARDPRVRRARVDTLPPGWLGKPHACQRGGELARSEWILFTDGDVWLAPDVLARAIAVARREGVDHVVLAPRNSSATWLGQMAINAFAVAISREMALANRDSPRRQVGIGAFNLVRADAWRAIGGHTLLAYEVVDDLRLGLLLRRGGFRTRAYVALHDVEAEWAASIPGILSALQKNMFAQLGYSVARSVLASLGIAALWLGALSGPFFGSTAGWSAFGAFASIAIPAAISARRVGSPIGPALATPLGFGVLVLVVWNSMIATLWRGGVVWRGTLYPLAELRARRVR